EILAGGTVAPRVAVGRGAAGDGEVDRAVGGAAGGDVHVGLAQRQHRRLGDRDVEVRGAVVGVGHRDRVRGGGEAGEVLGGGPVAPGVGERRGAAGHGQVDRAVGAAITADVGVGLAERHLGREAGGDRVGGGHV